MKKQISNLSEFTSETNHIYPHKSLVSREIRNARAGHTSGVIWLTGLSGAGKSTIASAVEQRLFNQNYQISILDGDSLRTGLNVDLDFSTESRAENLRRTGEVASLFAKNGNIVLASFISPHHKGRESVKNIVGKNFYLVHIKAELDDCKSRDPKGLYKKAESGEIKNFTGISQPYETPDDADLVINTSKDDIETCITQLITFIEERFTVVPPPSLNTNRLLQQCQK